ncbi:signal transduction histidine kinase [Arthrobacter pigmenti]|uniref:histidine kinase n=1 Tax=Arthrobacter pigmenti TaxID=271432 RepID=A0A846S119_9MICC|nr:sensor histidine kinase [Arthrobacter pigmenti]NJC24131.1 signal transduction histidine kinase [Arthrobacter pigmenti]
MSEKTSVKGTAERTAAVSFTEINARRLGPIRRFFRNRPRVMDAVVVLLFLLASVPNVFFAAEVPTGWWSVLPIGVAAVILAFRRSRPLIVLALLCAVEPFALLLSEARSSVGIAIWFALYVVAVSHKIRVAIGALIGALVISIAPLWFTPNMMPDEFPFLIWVVMGFIVMWYAVAMGVGVSVRRERKHENELRDWADRNAELASANERNRIAREMHDVVAHSLSVMVALSDGAAVVMKRDQDRARQVLTELSATGRTALADMRRVLGVLREGPDAAPLAPLPATGSLASLLDGFRAAGLPIRVQLSGPGLPGDPAFELTVYRIIQESLTNVLRYGKAVTTVDVAIARVGSTVKVRVSDDGRGAMEPAASIGTGQGIAGMRERAAIYGGTVKCGPGPSGGWVVSAALEIPQEQEKTA